MAKKPNYDHERRERDRLKALKKTEKLNAKAAKSAEARQDNDQTNDDAQQDD